MDLHFNELGDIEVAPNGDIRLTEGNWRDDLQQAYIRMMTDIGDFDIDINHSGGTCKSLGADLSRLYGMPQSPTTGQMGVSLIESSLTREGRFAGRNMEVQAIPTDHDKIRFDCFIPSGDRGRIRLSVEQDLDVA